MRGLSGLWLVAALVLAVPVPAQEVSAPDRLEQLMWQGALSANTSAAYGVYLRRYPGGSFAPLARDNLAKLGGAAPTPGSSEPMPANPPAETSLPAAPIPAPPPPAPAPVAEAGAASPLFLCRPVFAAGSAPLDRASEAELASYLEATRLNSLDAYRQYLELWPQGLFAPEVAALVQTRTARANGFAATPIPGPAAARLRHPLDVTPADYPPQARRAGQSGAVGAVWEIGEDGCVQSCRIDRSSGSAALDAATCRTITLRGRYDPARDAAGKPIRAIGSTTIDWTLPK